MCIAGGSYSYWPRESDRWDHREGVKSTRKNQIRSKHILHSIVYESGFFINAGTIMQEGASSHTGLEKVTDPKAHEQASPEVSHSIVYML